MNDGGPAFPYEQDRKDAGLRSIQHPGLSLRDYFAAQALTGVLAMCADPDAAKPTNEDAAGMAYDYADAMLTQRGKDSSDRNPVTHVNAGHGGEAPK